MSGLGQSLGAALGQFAFGGNTRDAWSKGMMDGAKTGLLDAQRGESLAQRLKVEAERRMLEQQEDARRPENVFRNTLRQYAIPDDDANAVEHWTKTGQLGGRYAPPGDGVGPTMAAPEWAGNLPALARSMSTTQLALTLGDKSVKNAAEAEAVLRESALGDDVIAGRVDPLKVSQSQFALKGTAPFAFNEYGVGNNLTGTLDDTTGPAVRFGNKRVAETKAERAQEVQRYAAAGASNASAESSRATAEKTRGEIKDGKWQYDSARGGRVNLQTGEFQPVTQGGKPVGPEQGSGGPVLGVPVPTVLPWANQTNERDANKVKAAEAARGGKEIEKDIDSARKEAQTAEAAKRFIELNERVDTGGPSDRWGPTRSVQSLGKEYAEMEAITARLVPGMRDPGSGVSSDLDVRMFERGTVGVDKPRQTNVNIGKAIVARSQMAQDYADFRATYLEQNGTLQGADRHWKEYANANPIFDHAKKDYSLNQGRRHWREHFQGGQAPAAKDKPTRTVTRTGTLNGRKVVQYSDGTTEYAD